MSFQLTRNNGGAVLRRLEKLYDIHANNRVQKAVADKMDEVHQRVQKAAPVRTGYMRSTVGRRSAQGLEELHVTAYYASYVDQGAQGRRKNPFFSSNVAGLSAELTILIRGIYGVL